MSNDLVNGTEFEQLSVDHGDSVEPEADKPLLHCELSDSVKEEHYENEPPEGDVGDAADQSAYVADVKPELSSTADTSTSCAENVDPKTSFGMLCVKLKEKG